MKHERHVFEWLASVQHQAGCYGHGRILLRAHVVDGCVVIEAVTRSAPLGKVVVTSPEWLMLACTGDWREHAPQRPEQGVTWTRYSCTLDASAFERVLTRFVRRGPAREQERRRSERIDSERAHRRAAVGGSA